MPVIIDLSATTELEAVNAMLAAVGEQPLAPATDLDDIITAGSPADVIVALNILRDTAREVLSMGWKFNTEFGYEVAPAATYSWVDTAGVTTLLNIFKPPAGLISFVITPTAQQENWRRVDTELRPSRKYVESMTPVVVFYDRRRSRDGFPAAEHPYLYINPTWLFDFEVLPEVARRYITAKAARTFVEGTVGSEKLSDFSKRNEAIALRNLQREQGEEDTYNWLGNADAQQARGGRFGGPSGMFDPRTNRGPV